MSCEAVTEVVMANRSDWHLLEPANTPGHVAAVALMRRRCADFHRGPGRNFTPYQRPDVWQQPDPFTPSTAWHWGAVHVWHCFCPTAAMRPGKPRTFLLRHQTGLFNQLPLQ